MGDNLILKTLFILPPVTKGTQELRKKAMTQNPTVLVTEHNQVVLALKINILFIFYDAPMLL